MSLVWQNLSRYRSEEGQAALEYVVAIVVLAFLFFAAFKILNIDLLLAACKSTAKIISPNAQCVVT